MNPEAVTVQTKHTIGRLYPDENATSAAAGKVSDIPGIKFTGDFKKSSNKRGKKVKTAADEPSPNLKPAER